MVYSVSVTAGIRLAAPMTERHTTPMPRSNRAAAGGKSRAAVRAKNRKLQADRAPEKKGKRGK